MKILTWKSKCATVLEHKEEIVSLKFEEIKELAKKRISELERKNQVKELTPQELNDIEFFVKEIERYIFEYANKGKQKFIYDCSKLKAHVFYALAVTFKEGNPGFFVTTRGGCQELTVEWTGKNEV